MTDDQRTVELDAQTYINALERKVSELVIEVSRLSALLEAITHNGDELE